MLCHICVDVSHPDESHCFTALHWSVTAHTWHTYMHTEQPLLLHTYLAHHCENFTPPVSLQTHPFLSNMSYIPRYYYKRKTSRPATQPDDCIPLSSISTTPSLHPLHPLPPSSSPQRNITKTHHVAHAYCTYSYIHIRRTT